MAAPQRRYRASLPTQPMARPAGKPGPDRAARRKAASRRRGFAVLVVVPVLLMLGSVYLHTVAAGLGGRVAGLEEEIDRAEARGERLEVQVAELSGAERIRPLATEKLGMRDPGSEDLNIYRGDREDGIQDGREQKGGEPRRR